ncbi:MAG TPA: ABC transporter substrate-binding protein [Candidatus Binatia bacterium]|jgi:ABC-type nitrate/sulfonate/bicarbonate transport system substrate-binding protein
MAKGGYVKRALKILGFCAVSSPAFCVAAEGVMIATPGPGMFEMPVVAAMRNGYFRKEGLEVYKLQVQPDIAVRALVAREIDYSLAWGASIRAAMTGVPIKLVAAMTSKPMHVFISRPELRFARDLKGKNIGVDGLNGTIDYLSRVATRYLGLDPERDISIVETGDSALRLAALQSGIIAATVVDVVVAVRAQAAGFNRLVDLGDIIDLPISGIAVTEAKLANQREQIKKIIRATLRGTRFIKQNRPESLRMMQSYLRITPAQATRIYGVSVGSLTGDGLVSNRAIAVDMRRAREQLALIEDPSLSRVVDWSLLGEITSEKRKLPFWLKLDEP